MLVYKNVNEVKRKKQTGFFWNLIGGGLVASQTAILLFFVARNYGQELAGITSISYAIAILIYTIAKYGMRNYQATDVNAKYPFSEYLASRIISVFAALVLVVLYLAVSYAINGYSLFKILVIFEIVVLRMVNAVEDVFCGQLQRSGRFYEGARIMALREALTLTILIVFLWFKVDLRISYAVGVVFSILIEIFLLRTAGDDFLISHTVVGLNKRSLLNLMKECFPLLIGTSAAIYISNIPKYVTDWYMDDISQAIVGYLILPVFTIALLNQFIYTPFISDLAEIFHGGEKELFYRKILRQIILVVIFTVIIGIVSVIVGIPVLSYIYGIDLSPYNTVMILLMIGGGLYAIEYYLTIPMTIIERQGSLAYGYIVAIVISFLIQKRLAQNDGLQGVGIIYIVVNLILTLFEILVIVIHVVNNKRY